MILAWDYIAVNGKLLESNIMTRSNETKGFTFDMPTDHYDLLKKIAKDEDIKVSQIMRSLVREYLDDRMPKK